MMCDWEIGCKFRGVFTGRTAEVIAIREDGARLVRYDDDDGEDWVTSAAMDYAFTLVSRAPQVETPEPRAFQVGDEVNDHGAVAAHGRPHAGRVTDICAGLLFVHCGECNATIPIVANEARERLTLITPATPVTLQDGAAVLPTPTTEPPEPPEPADVVEACVPETHCPGCCGEIKREPGYSITRRGLKPGGRWWHTKCLGVFEPLSEKQQKFLDKPTVKSKPPRPYDNWLGCPECGEDVHPPDGYESGSPVYTIDGDPRQCSECGVWSYVDGDGDDEGGDVWAVTCDAPAPANPQRMPDFGALNELGFPRMPESTTMVMTAAAVASLEEDLREEEPDVWREWKKKHGNVIEQCIGFNSWLAAREARPDPKPAPRVGDLVSAWHQVWGEAPTRITGVVFELCPDDRFLMLRRKGHNYVCFRAGAEVVTPKEVL